MRLSQERKAVSTRVARARLEQERLVTFINLGNTITVEMKEEQRKAFGATLQSNNLISSFVILSMVRSLNMITVGAKKMQIVISTYFQFTLKLLMNAEIFVLEI